MVSAVCLILSGPEYILFIPEILKSTNCMVYDVGALRKTGENSQNQEYLTK